MYRNCKLAFSRLCWEFVLWLAPSHLFIAIFAYKYSIGLEASVLHLAFVSQLFLLVIFVRCVAYRWMGRRFAQWIGTVFFTAVFFSLTGYYIAALVGLDGWGRLISWALIITYAAQASYLMESLGLNIYLFAIVFALIFIATAFGIYSAFLKKDGLEQVAVAVSKPAFYGAFLLAVTVLGISGWRFVTFPMADTGEPFSVTFHPEMIVAKLQTHHQFLSPKLNAAEIAAKEGYMATTAHNPANVIFIVVDALRADHLSMNGYHRRTTPYLEQLMRAPKWRNFSNAYSVCSESACGLMALSSARNMHYFVDQPFTIQEVLRRHGYSINMILGGDHTNFYGLREAYGHVDNYFDAAMSKDHYINDDAAIVNRLNYFPPYAGRPTFFQFHLMSVHGLGARENATAPYQPSVNYYADAANRALRGGLEKKSEYENFYDNGIYMADKKIELLMAILQSKGYLENAIVVLTADHGEYIGENDMYGHAKGVGKPVLNIPLLVGKYSPSHWNDMPEKSVVSIIDIAPTVLFELGVPRPSSWQGRPLQERGEIFGVAAFQQAHEYGVVEGDGGGAIRKFSVNARTGKESVYDVVSDPTESQDISERVPSTHKIKWRQQLIEIEVNARNSLGLSNDGFFDAGSKSK